MKPLQVQTLVPAGGPTAPGRSLHGGGMPPGGDPRCPKRMVHGPCGGVQVDGSCEVGGPCAFVGPGGTVAPTPAAVAAAPATLAAKELRALMARRQLIIAELPSPGPDPDTERRLASALAGTVDAVLLGDAPWSRLQLSPAVRASIVGAEGVRPWAGLNCRDRNRVALRSELAALAAVGAPAVHCVTGDHARAHGGNGAAPGVFDLDSVQLAGLAAGSGLVVSVAESPAAPPINRRPVRAASKAEAGAGICFVNHAGDARSLAHFVAATRALAPGLRIIVCVPMVISRAGADRLSAFLPGPPPAAVRETLESRDPVGTAVAGAVEHATEVLGIDGVDGIDLSAPAGPGEEHDVAAALASVGRILGGGA